MLRVIKNLDRGIVLEKNEMGERYYLGERFFFCFAIIQLLPVNYMNHIQLHVYKKKNSISIGF